MGRRKTNVLTLDPSEQASLLGRLKDRRICNDLEGVDLPLAQLLEIARSGDLSELCERDRSTILKYNFKLSPDFKVPSPSRLESFRSFVRQLIQTLQQQHYNSWADGSNPGLNRIEAATTPEGVLPLSQEAKEWLASEIASNHAHWQRVMAPLNGTDMPPLPNEAAFIQSAERKLSEAAVAHMRRNADSPYAFHFHPVPVTPEDGTTLHTKLLAQHFDTTPRQIIHPRDELLVRSGFYGGPRHWRGEFLQSGAMPAESQLEEADYPNFAFWNSLPRGMQGMRVASWVSMIAGKAVDGTLSTQDRFQWSTRLDAEGIIKDAWREGHSSPLDGYLVADTAREGKPRISLQIPFNGEQGSENRRASISWRV